MNELKSFFTQHWLYLAVRAACRIDLFDKVEKEPICREDLIALLGTNKMSTGHLIDALITHRFLLVSSDKISLSELSEYLTDSSPNSLKYACLLWGGEHMDVWQNLDETISSGKPTFPKMYSKSFFDYLDDNKQESIEYHKAMYEYARDDYRGIENVVDLSDSEACADIGGANGALVGQLYRNFGDVRFTIFDKQDHRHLSSHNTQFVQGDFFKEVPFLGDTYTLSRVLHDWSDEMAHVILSNCFKSLPQGGSLFVIENDLTKLGDGAHLLSLNMMAVCDSFERTPEQYLSLLTDAGFTIDSTKNHNHLLVIKAIKL